MVRDLVNYSKSLEESYQALKRTLQRGAPDSEPLKEIAQEVLESKRKLEEAWIVIKNHEERLNFLEVAQHVGAGVIIG